MMKRTALLLLLLLASSSLANAQQLYAYRDYVH